MIYRDKCRHFNGIQHVTCAAGIRYNDVHSEKQRLPCLDTNLRREVPMGACASCSYLTQEEHAEQTREIYRAVTTALASLDDGKCHVCKADIEPSKIVGRCKYGACGHRIGRVAS